MKTNETNDVIDRIYEMEYMGLMQVIKALLLRWEELDPDNELCVLVIPRDDPEEKKRRIESAFQMVDSETEYKATQREAQLAIKKPRSRKRICKDL